MKSEFKMVNLVRGYEPEIIPFEIIYDERVKKRIFNNQNRQ